MKMNNTRGIRKWLLLSMGVGSIVTTYETAAQEATSAPHVEYVPASEIDWGALNPARGALGPKAANLWGDRAGSGPSGFLVKFVDGFQSPPHIHNITYRGIVISGEVHNDDPAAAPMWMPVGSYWTQPAGEIHITAARGNNNLVYVEIQEGPYLVEPVDQANDNGERPVNVHTSNIVWLDASTTNWIDGDANSPTSPELAFLWGNPQDDEPSGTLVRFPAGFSGTVRCDDSIHRAIVVQGELVVRGSAQNKDTLLEPGSYFGATGTVVVEVPSEAEQPSVIYIRGRGKFLVKTM